MKVPLVFILWKGLHQKVTIYLSPERLSSILPKDKLSLKDSLNLMLTGRVSIMCTVPNWGRVTAQVLLAPSLQKYKERLQELWKFNSDHGQNFSFSHFLFFRWLLALQNAMWSKNFKNVWATLQHFACLEPERTIILAKTKIVFFHITLN